MNRCLKTLPNTSPLHVASTQVFQKMNNQRSCDQSVSQSDSVFAKTLLMNHQIGLKQKIFHDKWEISIILKNPTRTHVAFWQIRHSVQLSQCLIQYGKL